MLFRRILSLFIDLLFLNEVLSLIITIKPFRNDSLASLYNPAYDNENKLTFQIEDKEVSVTDIGASIDSFLGPRPWWVIEKEPIKSSDDGKYVIDLIRFDKKFDEVFRQISKVQYPSSCADKALSFTLTEGFDSLGNNFYNYANGAASVIWDVYSPYITAHKSQDISFLDEGSCLDVLNKFYCAFIPTTNCSFPYHLDECGRDRAKCPRNSHFFSNATKTGVLITGAHGWDLSARSKEVHVDPRGPDLRGKTYFGMFNNRKLEISDRSHSPRNHLMAYAFIFRLNYYFRSRIAHEIEKRKASLNPPFPSDGDCVAAHIRRSDRHVKGQNMKEWCEKHKINPDGSCWDDEAKTVDKHGNCVHFYDMGCNTAFPYGLLTVSHFLNVSRDVFKKKNVFVMTDDGHAVEEELKLVHDTFNVFRFPAPHNHRKGSTANGVNYLAGLVIASECSAFIGHSGSAVTNFFMDILCVHHTNKWGECPPFFDFSK